MSMPVKGPKNLGMIYTTRALHVALGIMFLASIATVYFYAWIGGRGLILYLAISALLAEGVVLAINKGQCPLTTVQHRFGDDRGFFDLFLPDWMLPYVVPVLFVLTAVGILLALT